MGRTLLQMDLPVNVVCLGLQPIESDFGKVWTRFGAAGCVVMHLNEGCDITSWNDRLAFKKYNVLKGTTDHVMTKIRALLTQ